MIFNKVANKLQTQKEAQTSDAELFADNYGGDSLAHKIQA